MKVRCRETAVFQPLYLKYSLRWMVQGDALVCVMLSCVWLSMLHVLGGDNVSHVFHTAVLLCGWPLCRLHVTWVTCAAEHYTSICSVHSSFLSFFLSFLRRAGHNGLVLPSEAQRRAERQLRADRQGAARSPGGCGLACQACLQV